MPPAVAPSPKEPTLDTFKSGVLLLCVSQGLLLTLFKWVAVLLSGGSLEFFSFMVFTGILMLSLFPLLTIILVVFLIWQRRWRTLAGVILATLLTFLIQAAFVLGADGMWA